MKNTTTDLIEDIEQSVIGCLMVDYAGASSEMADFAISAEMFLSGTARKIFETIQTLATDQSPIDPITVREKLRSGSVDDCKITKFLTDSIDNTPTAAHTAYYAQLLKQSHERRRLRSILQAADRRLEEQPADMVQADLMRTLEKNDADPVKDGITFAEATDNAVETFKKIEKGERGIMTGFPFMDSAGGLQPGELVIISGKAGSCKTTLAKQILSHACGVDKIPSALLTFEMTEEQIAAQALTDQSHTSYRKFMAGVANKQDWDALLAAKSKTEKWPLEITSRARTPASLSTFVRKVARRGAKLIVLDYLQACKPDPNMAKATMEQQVTFTSSTVRDLAKTLKLSFIVVSTESREGELRYSDAIRYDALKWYRMIQPEENNEDNPVYHLEVKKLRFGILPKSVRPLYRVGERLLTDTEWAAYSKR